MSESNLALSGTDGGKGAFQGKLANWIVSLMAPHLHYVEPYAGGLSVLLAKSPEGVSECVNDLNGRLTNFWRVIANSNLFSDFQRIVQSVPFSEREWDEASTCSKFVWHKNLMVHDAVTFFIFCRQSLAGRMKSFAPLSKTRTRRGMNEQASAWLSAIEGLPAVHERMKRVVVVGPKPAVDVIREQDGEQTLFYCLVPDTLVRRSSEELVPISEVSVGDRLHGGRVVKSVMCRDYSGEVLSIRIQGVPDVVVSTPDHPFVVVPKCSGKQEKRSDEEFELQKSIVLAADLRVGDLVPVPVGGAEGVPDFCLDAMPRSSHARLKPVHLSVGPELFRLLGYYAAEGHIQYGDGVPRGVILSFGTKKKQRHIADAAACGLKSFGVEWGVYPARPHPTVTQVAVCSTSIARFFAEHVVGTATVKRLSVAVMTAPVSWQIDLLSSWVRSDGHEGRDGGRSVKLCGTSSSKVMAVQMYSIALRCGLKPSFKSRHNGTGRMMYDVYFASECARRLGVPVCEFASRSTRRIVGGNLYSRVRSIQSIYYSGPVYNLDVDGDNLFGSPFVLTHNCDPPYVHETRANGNEYGDCEMSGAQHQDLLEILSKIKGKFVLSGYRSHLYNDFAALHGWRSAEFEIVNNAAGGDTKRKMTEVCWMNY